jgi:hypothetical protein
LSSVDWGQDPSIRWMRRIFRSIESSQAELLRRAGITPFDPRLRPWRERALRLFGAAWTNAQRSGRDVGEAEASALYNDCLWKVLSESGVSLPADAEPPAKFS